METLPHSPNDGIYAASDDYVHALEVRAQTLVEDWLVELEVIAVG